MSLKSAFESLCRELGKLEEAVGALQVTIREDQPARGSVVLVDQLDNLVADMSGALEEAFAHAAQAVRANQPDGPLDKERRALGRVHELLNRFISLYAGELSAHDPLARLLEMGRERGREWREWTQIVKTAIGRCAGPLKATASAVLDCWTELTESLARHSVAVQATKHRAANHFT